MRVIISIVIITTITATTIIDTIHAKLTPVLAFMETSVTAPGISIQEADFLSAETAELFEDKISPSSS